MLKINDHPGIPNDVGTTTTRSLARPGVSYAIHYSLQKFPSRSSLQIRQTCRDMGKLWAWELEDNQTGMPMRLVPGLHC